MPWLCRVPSCLGQRLCRPGAGVWQMAMGPDGSSQSGTVLIVDQVVAFVETDLLQPRINRLALQRQHPENAFMNAAQRFLADESLQRLNAQGKLPDGERPFSRKPS